MPLAYWISYRRRAKDNWHIKIAITIFAIFALIRFFGQLRGIATLDEVRFPLADLFLWVQVLHGFDLPARKDLNFSLGSSLTSSPSNRRGSCGVFCSTNITWNTG